MSSRKHSIIINIVMWGLLILFFVFNIVLAATRWFCSVELSKDVSPTDIASLLLSSLATLFLGYYVTKKLTESRAEKDSLIEDLKKIESYMYAIQGILKEYEMINLQQITAEMEMAVLSINRFKQSLQIVGETIDTEPLENSFFSLYTLSTDFGGNTVLVEDVSSGSILQKSDRILIEVRRLMHTINTR